MKIALAQLALQGSVQENLAKAQEQIARAAASGAKLIVFPEVQLGPFFAQHAGQDVSHLVVQRDGPEMATLADAAKRHGIVVAANVYLEQDGKRYDASPTFDADGTLLGISHMVHVVDAPCFHEQDYYTPSPGGFPVYDSAAGKVGVVICFDRHYPESVRRCALDGAELVVIPTANHTGEPLELFEWEMRVAAYHNGLYVALCNRVGSEDALHFAGESLVAGPDGELVAKAGAEETLLVVDIEPERVCDARRRRPFLALRRPGPCALD